ncbi:MULTISPECIES: class I SAM-dependent methyltransferase [unclassified Geodermatophilus]|uniref:class I SAM-dependent methyltransferase n=1 Tax=unclassified Geodermatophilus TaxID=2637632 RepID=UPI003EEE5FC2
MTDTTSSTGPRTPVDGGQRAFLPGLSHAWLLPLYDPLTRLLHVGVIHQRLVDQAALRPGQTVLEIGCGTGNLLLAAKRAQPEATAVGLDPDLAALARAHRKAKRRRVAVQLDRGYADALPYADASIDVVLSSFMLHHLPGEEQETAMREVLRVLRPGGTLHLVDADAPDPTAAHGHGHVHHRGPIHDHAVADVPALLRRAGFAEVTRTGSETRRPFGRFSSYRATR